MNWQTGKNKNILGILGPLQIKFPLTEIFVILGGKFSQTGNCTL